MKSPLKYEETLKELPNIQEKKPYVFFDKAVPVESTAEYADMRAIEKHERQRIEGENEEKRKLKQIEEFNKAMMEKSIQAEKLKNLKLVEEKPAVNMIKRNSSVQFKLPNSKNY